MFPVLPVRGKRIRFFCQPPCTDENWIRAGINEKDLFTLPLKIISLTVIIFFVK